MENRQLKIAQAGGERAPAGFGKAKALIVKCGGCETIKALPLMDRLELDVAIAKELGYANAARKREAKLDEAKKEKARGELKKSLFHEWVEKRPIYHSNRPMECTGSYCGSYFTGFYDDVTHYDRPDFEKAGLAAKCLDRDDVEKIALWAYGKWYRRGEAEIAITNKIAAMFGLGEETRKAAHLRACRDMLRAGDCRGAKKTAEKNGFEEEAKKAVELEYNIVVNEQWRDKNEASPREKAADMALRHALGEAKRQKAALAALREYLEVDLKEFRRLNGCCGPHCVWEEYNAFIEMKLGMAEGLLKKQAAIPGMREVAVEACMEWLETDAQTFGQGSMLAVMAFAAQVAERIAAVCKLGEGEFAKIQAAARLHRKELDARKETELREKKEEERRQKMEDFEKKLEAMKAEVAGEKAMKSIRELVGKQGGPGMPEGD